MIHKWYMSVADKEEGHDLLFVDTFTCCRVPAVLYLGPQAKWIIIHDLEPPGPEVYQWALLDDFLRPWRKYLLKPEGVVGAGYPIPWTGLFSRKPLDVEALNDVVAIEALRLWGREARLEECQWEGH